MIRTVKGIYTCRKDHTAKSMVFSPWSRTLTPFPLLCRKIQAFQNESRQTTVWDNNNAMPYFPPLLNPNIIQESMSWVRPRLDGLTDDKGLTL